MYIRARWFRRETSSSTIFLFWCIPLVVSAQVMTLLGYLERKGVVTIAISSRFFFLFFFCLDFANAHGACVGDFLRDNVGGGYE